MPKQSSPMAYFPQGIAKISYKKVDAWAERQKTTWPFFETWEEAHAFMVERAKKDIKKAERELASSKRHLASVLAMPPKNNQKDKADGFQ
ncbi:MAG: hypothetical protein K8L99_32810 [Anaerolineae bacterium]|jgi:hypothetical protein|nr:hypothetical protein [Anaerolineae bacterium]MCL4722773.1 hypothetical protein [Rhodocyclaceae bacterium]MCZ2112839.1 hypothetical protein [Anaerolineae bacterium]GIK44745.1 MAG: hypothetical protein BroJett012_06480 [Betaproteobacteria bacterium]